MDKELTNRLPGQVLGLISAKGGTGKTTLVISIGRILSAVGFKVLLIDFDPATNALTLFFLDRVTDKRTQDSKGIFELTDNSTPNVVQIADNFDLMPAAFSLKDTSKIPKDESQNHLRKTIPQLLPNYDFILVDAEPGSEVSSKAVASLADHVLIVTEFDPMSRVAVARLERLFSDVLRPEATYYVANKVLPDLAQSLQANSTEQVFSIFSILPPIPFVFDVMRRFSFRKVPFSLDKLGPFETAIIRLVQALYPTTLPQVKQFQDMRREAERVPIRRRIDDLNDRLNSVRHRMEDLAIERARTRYRRERTLSLYLLLTISSLALAVALYEVGPANGSVLNLALAVTGVLAGSFVFLYLTRIGRIRYRTALEQSKIDREMEELEYDLRSLLQQKREYETLLEGQSTG